jgi:hypothetical protein
MIEVKGPNVFKGHVLRDRYRYRSLSSLSGGSRPVTRPESS